MFAVHRIFGGVSYINISKALAIVSYGNVLFNGQQNTIRDNLDYLHRIYAVRDSRTKDHESFGASLSSNPVSLLHMHASLAFE